MPRRTPAERIAAKKARAAKVEAERAVIQREHDAFWQKFAANGYIAPPNTPMPRRPFGL